MNETEQAVTWDQAYSELMAELDWYEITELMEEELEWVKSAYRTVEVGEMCSAIADHRFDLEVQAGRK